MSDNSFLLYQNMGELIKVDMKLIKSPKIQPGLYILNDYLERLQKMAISTEQSNGFRKVIEMLVNQLQNMFIQLQMNQKKEEDRD